MWEYLGAEKTLMSSWFIVMLGATTRWLCPVPLLRESPYPSHSREYSCGEAATEDGADCSPPRFITYYNLPFRMPCEKITAASVFVFDESFPYLLWRATAHHMQIISIHMREKYPLVIKTMRNYANNQPITVNFLVRENIVFHWLTLTLTHFTDTLTYKDNFRNNSLEQLPSSFSVWLAISICVTEGISKFR